MLTKNIRFKNFVIKSKKQKVKKIFENLKKDYFDGKLKLLSCLSKNYKYSFNKKLITNIRIIIISELLEWEDQYLERKLFIIF